MSPRHPAAPLLLTALLALTAAPAHAAETPAADVAEIAAEPEQQECLAQAIYFEARGEPEEAQKAVASVVLNRAEDPNFPETPCEVVRQGGESPPCQFSWWCDGKPDLPAEKGAWKTALQIAEEVAADPLDDPTQGAVYFHHVDTRPGWRKAFERVGVIGEHIFYRDEPDEPQVAEKPGDPAAADTAKVDQ